MWGVSVQIQQPPWLPEKTQETHGMLLHLFPGGSLCDRCVFVPWHVTPADLVIMLADGKLSISPYHAG